MYILKIKIKRQKLFGVNNKTSHCDQFCYSPIKAYLLTSHVF